MTRIDCTDIKALLSPYIDGELDEQKRHLVERHLGTCGHCRSLVDQAERLDALVAADVQAAVPAGLSADFYGAVMARTVYAEPQRDRWSTRRVATWTGWFAAAAAFALAAGVWVHQNTPQPAPEFASQDQSQSQGYAQTAVATERAATRTLDDDFYAAGVDLQSRTFEGALPAEAFRHAPRQRVASAADAETARPEQAFVASTLPLVDEGSMSVLMTPHAIQVSSRPVLKRPTIEREHADALYAASILMHLITAADARSFADVEHVRRVVEVDNLLPRLTEARDRLDPVDRPAVFAAESVLTRVSHGPLDSNDVLSLRDTVAALNLSGELGEITARWDRASSL